MCSTPIDPRYLAHLQNFLGGKRRAFATQSPHNFAVTYLTDEFNKQPSRMHKDLFDALLRLYGEPGSRLAVAAPRGHAKSTIATLAFPMWAALCHNEPFTVLASSTDDQSSLLLDHIRRQVEENKRLRSDFPELVTGKKPKPWRKRSLLLPGGQMFRAFSTNQNPRGIKHRQHRPTLIVCDDLESLTGVVYEEQRAKMDKWFNATMLKVGTPETRVVVVGNILHEESLLAGLLDSGHSPAWESLCFQAVEQFSAREDLWDLWTRIYKRTETYQNLKGKEGARSFLLHHYEEMLAGTQVLWPQKYSYTQLMEERANCGAAAFEAEFQNQPLNPDTCAFAKTPLTYWDDDPMTVERFLAKRGYRWGEYHGGDFYCACDPSLGSRAGRGDYSAIILLYRPHGSKQVFVLEADIERRTPEQTIERIVEIANRYVLTKMVVEANGFQRVLFTLLKARLEATYCRRVEPVNNSSHKQARIMALQPAIACGQIVLSRKHTLLLSQLRGFPAAKHDDGPDALQMAYEASQRSHSITWINTHNLPRVVIPSR